MPIPSQQLTIRDPGLGLTEPADNRFAFLGTSSTGTLNTVVPVSTPAAAVDAFGEGPLSEALCYALEVGGGPVHGVRITGSIAGTTGAVTVTRVGTSTGTLGAAGAAFDRYEAIVEITRTGTLGAGEFRYSLDAGRTWAEPRVIPAGGTYAVPRTNVTITFTAGAGPVFFERGDRFSFTTTAPHYGAADVNAGLDALSAYLSTSPALDLDAVVLTGRNATGTAAATLFGALSVRLAGFATVYRYLGAIMDAGSGDSRAAVKTAFAAVSDPRIAVVYGDAVTATTKSYAGFSAPLQPAVHALAGRALASLPSTDIARYADGSLKGVTAVSHDEFVTEDLDAAGISTLRTWPGSPGFYATNLRMKSAPGSDYQYWQHRRLMDIACRTVIRAQVFFASSGFSTNPDGTIEDTEAKIAEASVRSQLDEALLSPKNVEGRRGHVTAVSYQIDRSNNFLSSQTLRSYAAIQPRGYTKFIVTEIGYALGVGA